MSVNTFMSKKVGTRTILNTDWPVETVIQRQEYSGSVEWVVIEGLCNGVAGSSSSYKTRREALDAFGEVV